MTDEKQDRLNGVLDAALAKYAAVEPRVGLEDRLLANLRAEQARVPQHVWWRWSIAGALAAVVVVALAVALVWKAGNHRAPVIAIRPPTPAPSRPQSGTRATSNGGAIPRAPIRRSPPRVVVAASPKLDQFPSRRPLSEQEQLLVRYVHEFPEDAVLVAKAQAESEKESEAPSGNLPPATSPDQSHDQ